MAKFRFKVNGRTSWYGETDFGKRIVTINKKKAKKDGKLGETLRHEKFHIDHPKAKEKAAYKAEKKKLPKKQMNKLYASFKRKKTS